MTLYTLDGVHPTLPQCQNYWMAPDTHIIGDVRISEWVSIWFGSVLRGDNEPITIGEGSNIQEHCVLHTDIGFPLKVGADCTIGHRVILHGCHIEDGCLIGMGATLLNGSRIGEKSVVGANSLVTERKEFPAASLIMGSPAQLVRRLTEEECDQFGQAAAHYRSNITRYQDGFAALPKG